MFKIKSILLVTLSMLLSAEILAAKELPETVCHCQVVTISGSHGLVSIQTYSLEDASKDVVGKTAITLLGEKDAAAHVIQCIEQGAGQTFTDSSFQAWVEKLDQ